MARWRRANRSRVSGIGYRLMAVVLIVSAFGAIHLPASAQDDAIRPTAYATLTFAPDLPELPDLAPDLFLANFGEEIDAAIRELRLVLAYEPERVDVHIVARSESGVAAMFDPATGTIVVDGPVLTGRTIVDAVNQLRGAIATQFAFGVSNGNLAPLFLAGIAAYAQGPLTPVISRHAANLQNANSQGALLSWADLNRSAANPAVTSDVADASIYAVTAWLIDHYQLASYQQFLREMGETTDWRVAIERAYGTPAAEVERRWREDVPRWTNSGWKTNIIAGFDLDPARTLLERGNYAAAKVSLERSQRLFTELGDAEQLQVVTALLAQTELGLQAEALMAQTETALKQHNYERAADLIGQAEAQYARMPPDQRPEAVLIDYRTRANAGLEAIRRLENANRLANSWTEFPQARSDALSAGRAFAELGDATRLAASEKTLAQIDQRVRRLVYLLGGLAFLSFVWLLLWRRHGANIGTIWPEPVRSIAEAGRGD